MSKDIEFDENIISAIDDCVRDRQKGRQQINSISNVEIQTLRQLSQIGLTRSLLEAKGITDLDEVAKGYDVVWNAQFERQEFCYDRHTRLGSDAIAQVVSEREGVVRDCIIWSINHYLGLNRHPYVITKAKAALDKFGTGSGTSAVSGGHSPLHRKLQKRLATMLGKEAALLYTTGFTANLGAISAIARRGKHLILIDRESHASIIEGCRLSGAKYLPFHHNSIADLESKLGQYGPRYDNVLVVAEAVYSMSGDEAPLKEMVALKDKYRFRLFVDEAHTFGVYGPQGRCRQLRIEHKVDFIMTTLSMATSSIGGVVAVNGDMRLLLMCQSNSYLFQSAMSPPDAATIDACLDVLESEPEHVWSLWEKTEYFRGKLTSHGFDLGLSRSPVVPIYVRDPQKLNAMGKELFEHGIFTVAVTYPAVRPDAVRFRFIVNNAHTYDQIDYTIGVLANLGLKYGLVAGSK